MPAKFQTAERISYMRFSPDGKRVAAFGDSDVYVLDAKSGQLIEKLAAPQSGPPQCHAKHGLWMGARQTHFLLWGAAELKLPGFTTHQKWALSPKSDLLAIGSSDPHVIDLSSGRIVTSLKIKILSKLEFSADGKKLLIASMDKTIQVISLPDGQLVKTLTFPEHCYDFTLLPDNKRLIIVNLPLKLVDTDTGAEIRTYCLPGADGTNAIKVPRSGGFWAASAALYLGEMKQVYTVRIGDIETGREYGVLRSSNGDIGCFDISDDGERLAAWGEDNQIQIWDVPELLKTLSAADDPDLKKGRAAAELRQTLFSRVAHGMKLDQIYELNQGLFPAQLQNEYAGDKKELSGFLLNPAAPPMTEINLRLRYGTKAFDVLHMDPGLMVHERVIDLFKAKGFKGWQAIEISPEFYTKPDGKYFGLKINSVCGPIVYEASDGASDYRHVVDLAKWDGSDLFRPEAFAPIYLVTERVVQALSEAGITGWKAKPVVKMGFTDEHSILAPLPKKKKVVSKPGAKLAAPAIPKVVGARPPLEKVTALIRRHKLERIKDKILASAESAVYLTCIEAKAGTDAPGATRIGGSPDLPKSMEWPRHQKKPLAFLAQLRLSDFAQLIDKNVLPSAGLLSFFAPFDAEKQWTIDDGGWQVIFTADVNSLVSLDAPADFPAAGQFEVCALTMRPFVSLPHWESEVVANWSLNEDEAESYMDLLESSDSLNKTGEPRHQFLGHGQYLQSDAMRSTREAAARKGIAAVSEPWRMILQLDTDDKSGIDQGFSKVLRRTANQQKSFSGLGRISARCFGHVATT